ncbi:MAG: bifunctional riboflavin kinase/FAD synthetase [Gammaproteobacteria bacterium]|nr:bifunctional riboflavin kinase/FAD synthetase [Gammaproteobacteria bacterium]
MRLLRRFDACAQLRAGSVVTIGNYDGVHLGHRALIALVCEESRRLGLPSCVMSFEPMPSEFFGQRGETPGRLSTWRERYEQIKLAGIDVLYLEPFSHSTANMTAEEFIEKVLVAALNVKLLYVGDDFQFGKGRKGDVRMLREAGQKYGFELHEMSSVQVDHQRVSSTAIREHLLAGDLDAAAQMLGRRYAMSGRVVHGQHLGATLGFPTANIRPRRNSLPLTGIFAVRVYGAHPAGPIDGVANLGYRPTVGGGEALLEAHLLDFHGDLYGRRLNVEFIAKLREEEHFATVELMVSQMHLDEAQARAALKKIAS